MSIQNYGELKTAVANEVSRDTLTDTISELIARGEDWLYLDLRARFMETSASVSLVAAAQTSALPTDYLQARSIYITGTPPQRLEFRTPVEFWEIYAGLTTATPRYFTIEGEDFEWGPVPSTNLTATVRYYARPAALSDDSDTNGLFTLAPSLLIYATMLAWLPRGGADSRLLTYSALYDSLLEKVHAADKRDRSSGDAQIESRQAQLT